MKSLTESEVYSLFEKNNSNVNATFKEIMTLCELNSNDDKVQNKIRYRISKSFLQLKLERIKFSRGSKLSVWKTKSAVTPFNFNLEESKCINPLEIKQIEERSYQWQEVNKSLTRLEVWSMHIRNKRKITATVREIVTICDLNSDDYAVRNSVKYRISRSFLQLKLERKKFSRGSKLNVWETKSAVTPFCDFEKLLKPPNKKSVLKVRKSLNGIPEANIQHETECIPTNERTNKRENRPYQCTQCNKAFSSRSMHTSHMWIHKEEKHYQCSQCDTKFSNNRDLKIHNRIHTEGPYTCSTCDGEFSSYKFLRKHRIWHQKMFKKKQQTMKPIKKAETYQCTHCDNTFLNNKELACHFITHTENIQYPCTHCSRAFNNANTLMDHLKIHIVEGQYQCNMKIHTGEKEYQCSHCGKTFSSHGTFLHHLTIHTGVRPYVCIHCDKAFICNSDLLSHIRLEECISNRISTSETIKTLSNHLQIETSIYQSIKERNKEDLVDVADIPKRTYLFIEDQPKLSENSDTDDFNEPKIEVIEEEIYCENSDTNNMDENKVEEILGETNVTVNMGELKVEVK